MASRKGVFLSLLTAALSASTCVGSALADEVNIYSSRHYDTDERLYSDFTESTGIQVNLIEAGSSELLERLKAEGPNSPADVVITVDAGRLWAFEQADAFQPIASDDLNAAVPENLRDEAGNWYGISQRARVIFYNKDSVANPPKTYADLADPQYKGMICARSGTNIYMLSLLASQVAHHGEEAAKSWAKGLLDNLARDPQGGDTDQLRGIVSGECQISISNTYYFARAIRKEVKGLSSDIDKIGWIFPDQDGNGTHVNISGVAVAKYAPNKDNAVKFMEYLTSETAQNYFAAGNDEYPVISSVSLSSSVQELGTFKADSLPLEELGKNQATAQSIYNEIGYK